MVKQGITQFIDISSGLPTASNTHDVARRRRESVGVILASALEPETILKTLKRPA